MFKKVLKEQWKFPADVDHLGEMRDTISRYGRKYGVSEKVLNAFKLAIDEAGTNIIRHAYRDWEGDITLRMIIRDRTVTVSLIDQGHSFDMRNVQDPDLQRYVDIGKKGGLGIFIIRRVIDEIEYRKTEEGNELRLTKKRELPFEKRFVLPDVSFSMKTRFSVVASLIFSAIILVGFSIQYFTFGHKQRTEKLELGASVARSIAAQSLGDLADGYFFNLFEISKRFYDEHHGLVSDVLILDTTKAIQGAAVLGTESALRFFSPPKRIAQLAPNILIYKISDKYQIVNETLFFNYGKGSKQTEVYDIVAPVINSIPEVPVKLGEVHFLVNKDRIDEAVEAGHRRILILGLLSLAGGWAGIFGLVYITMNPFRRLTKWIRDIGHGEVRDEMEFDGTDEVGEIAQAFNEITIKFRKSQENLAEQERLQKEMQVAQEIQHTLLPASFPDIEGYEIASYYEAAKEVGGDYFDFVEVDRDTLGVVVADVSGKGVPGSLIMTMIRTALRTEARGNKNAAEVLSRVNDFVMNDMKRGMFVTIFYMILDSKKRTINYASAGHNPMILYRGQTQKSYYLNPRGFPIGISLPDKDLFRNSIESDSIQLREDDVLIVYTDGITEAMDHRRERFGDERLLESIRKYGNMKVEPLVEKLHQDISTFTGGHAQSDDITLVAIRERMNVEDVLYNQRNRLMRLVQVEKKSVKEACEIVGVSTSTYYRYKKRFDKMGDEGLRETTTRTEIEEKHISIEDKAKIFDIIKQHPDFGPKKISEELASDTYGNMQFDEARIYDELVRSRMNTRELRVAFAGRADHGKRMKPPGTPMLTLDGKVIIEKPEPMRTASLPSAEDKEIETSPIDISELEQQYKLKEADKAKSEAASKTEKPEFKDVPDTQKEKETKSFLDEFLQFDSMKDGSFPADESGLTERAPTATQSGMDADDDFIEIDGMPFGDTFTSEITKHPEDLKDKGTISPEEEIDEEMDVHLYEDIIDMVSDSTDEFLLGEISSVSEEGFDDKPSIDAILETENYIPELDEWDMVENGITGSAAEELMDDALTTPEKGPAFPNGDSYIEKEAGFVEMFEEMGFDRRSILGRQAKARSAQSNESSAYQSNRFIESGRWFYREGFYAKAVEEFQKVIQIKSDHIEAHQCLGDTFFRLGQLEKARRSYEWVRKLDPANINVLENLGVIFANQGDYKKAVWQWGEVLKMNPERKDIIERIKRMQRVIRQRSI